MKCILLRNTERDGKREKSGRGEREREKGGRGERERKVEVEEEGGEVGD